LPTFLAGGGASSSVTMDVSSPSLIEDAPPSTIRVLVVEDDLADARFLKVGLSYSDCSVDTVSTAAEALNKASNNAYDVITLDRNLPGGDGLAAIRAMRSSGVKSPVLVVSSLASAVDRAAGIEAGAQDYLMKPFTFVELEFRLKRLIAGSSATRRRTLSCGVIEMDLQEHTTTVDGVKVELRKREFEVLKVLLENKEKIVTRSELLDQVWGYNFDPQTRVVDVQIGRLRKTLEDSGAPSMIQVIRSVGFRISAQAD
jgi:two-component system, OmpR family, response regulator